MCVQFFRSKIRQRIDSSKLDYFVSWIIHSQLLISIPWGSTNMKLESGQIISIPQQMLQAQHSQIIYIPINNIVKLLVLIHYLIEHFTQF